MLLEFEAGVDIDLALIDVREKVDRAKAELPEETDEPIVEEVNLSLFPVLVVTLAGAVPERTLLTLARDLQDRLEALPDVLEVEIGGDREEVVEIVIDPLRIEAYDLQLETILGLVQRNNQLVAAGSWDVGQGRFAVKVPGLIEDLDGHAAHADQGRRRPGRHAGRRRRGPPHLQGPGRLRPGRRPLGAGARGQEADRPQHHRDHRAGARRGRGRAGALAGHVEVGYLQDKSDDIRTMLDDLGNNVLTAVALTMIITVAMLGLRSSLLVGLAVPVSFLFAMAVLGAAWASRSTSSSCSR